MFKLDPDIEARIAIAQMKWPQWDLFVADDGHVVWFEMLMPDTFGVHLYICSCGGSSRTYCDDINAADADGRVSGEWCQHLEDRYLTGKFMISITTRDQWVHNRLRTGRMQQN